DFSGLSADVIIPSKPNSNSAKMLAANSKKIVGANMSAVRTCTHIKVNGVPCGSPALRGKQFCYFHQRLFHGVKLPRTGLQPAALLENEEAIQFSLMQLVNALLNGTIELKRAEIVLRALNTAVRNARRVRFGIFPEDMVREVPNYDQHPESNLPSETPVAISPNSPDAGSIWLAHERPAAPSRTAAPSQASTAARTAPSADPRIDAARPKPPAGVKETIKKEAAVGKT
ncbi:MAG TPA: hypothetical protein VJQ54_21965, partial [Candidatus Sulfotelmatobacter sp.]|nr:hypothetical protein [Candidatus Sulfotelmatobacter sp.]